MKNIMAILMLFLFGCYDDDYPFCDADLIPANPICRDGTGKSILILGDSRGELGGTWGHLDGKICNAAQGRSTIDGIINRLYLVDEIKPDIIILFTGANDPAHMPASDYAEKLFFVTAYCEQRGSRIIITNPWVPEKSRVLLSDDRVWKTFIFFYRLYHLIEIIWIQQ